MSNVLDDDKQHEIRALGRVGWTLSRIQAATGVRRETISGYLKAAGIPVRGRGRPSESKPNPAISGEVSTDPGPSKPAISAEVSTDSEGPKPATRAEVSTDLAPGVRPGRAPSASACEPYRELISEALRRGRNAMAIWEDLVDDHGFTARYELATAPFIVQREDVLFLGPPGTGKSHLAQAIGRAAILQGYRVVYREAHTLLEELADATLDGTRKVYLADLATVPLLIIDDLGMRKLPHTAAEDLLEVVMRRYERASTLLTSNRPVDDWGKLLGDTAAVTALLDRLLHHAHVLKCGPRSWRTKVQTDLRIDEGTK